MNDDGTRRMERKKGIAGKRREEERGRKPLKIPDAGGGGLEGG